MVNGNGPDIEAFRQSVMGFPQRKAALRSSLEKQGMPQREIDAQISRFVEGFRKQASTHRELTNILDSDNTQDQENKSLDVLAVGGIEYSGLPEKRYRVREERDIHDKNDSRNIKERVLYDFSVNRSYDLLIMPGDQKYSDLAKWAAQLEVVEAPIVAIYDPNNNLTNEAVEELNQSRVFVVSTMEEILRLEERGILIPREKKMEAPLNAPSNYTGATQGETPDSRKAPAYSGARRLTRQIELAVLFRGT